MVITTETARKVSLGYVWFFSREGAVGLMATLACSFPVLYYLHACTGPPLPLVGIRIIRYRIDGFQVLTESFPRRSSRAFGDIGLHPYGLDAFPMRPIQYTIRPDEFLFTAQICRNPADRNHGSASIRPIRLGASRIHDYVQYRRTAHCQGMDTTGRARRRFLLQSRSVPSDHDLQ